MSKGDKEDMDTVWVEPFMKAVLSGEFSPGVKIPSVWIEGIHYMCSDRNQIEKGEPVVVTRSDGSKTIGVVSGDKQKDAMKFHLAGPELRVDVGSGLHKTLPLLQVGKLNKILLQYISEGGKGETGQDEILEAIIEDRKKFMAHYGQANAHAKKREEQKKDNSQMSLSNLFGRTKSSSSTA